MKIKLILPLVILCMGQVVYADYTAKVFLEDISFKEDEVVVPEEPEEPSGSTAVRFNSSSVVLGSSGSGITKLENNSEFTANISFESLLYVFGEMEDCGAVVDYSGIMSYMDGYNIYLPKGASINFPLTYASDYGPACNNKSLNLSYSSSSGNGSANIKITTNPTTPDNVVTMSPTNSEMPWEFSVKNNLNRQLRADLSWEAIATYNGTEKIVNSYTIVSNYALASNQSENLVDNFLCTKGFSCTPYSSRGEQYNFYYPHNVSLKMKYHMNSRTANVPSVSIEETPSASFLNEYRMTPKITIYDGATNLNIGTIPLLSSNNLTLSSNTNQVLIMFENGTESFKDHYGDCFSSINAMNNLGTSLAINEVIYDFAPNSCSTSGIPTYAVDLSMVPSGGYTNINVTIPASSNLNQPNVSIRINKN